MRRNGVLVTGFIAIALLAGCGDDDDDGVEFGGQPTTAPGGTSTQLPPVQPPVADGAVVPPDGTPVPAAQVDATALPDGYPTLVWTLDDGTAIGVYGQGGGCTEVSAALRGTDEAQVRVAVVETTTSAGPCTLELSYPPVTVALGDPLGGRTVVLTREQVGPPPGAVVGPR